MGFILRLELHEGVEKLRRIQNKAEPVINGKAKVSVTTLMATMVADFVTNLGAKSTVIVNLFPFFV